MATKFVSYRQESKINYGQDKTILSDGDTGGCPPELINTGSLQRIADATELIAKNYAQLVADRDLYYKWWKEEKESGQRMARRITALKGVVTKLKKKSRKDQAVAISQYISAIPALDKREIRKKICKIKALSFSPKKQPKKKQ